MRRLLITLLALVAATLAGCSRPSPEFTGKLERTAPWNPDFVAEMASLPVQDNGREKPISTFASFLLYKIHGRRDMKFEVPASSEAGDPERTKLEPTEWLLDVWCYPDQAADYPLFRIENVGVLDALKIPNDGQTLDFVYLSYRRLLRTSDELGVLAEDYDKIDAGDRNAVQEHIVQLWYHLKLYHNVHQQLSALHHDFKIEGDELRAVFGGEEQVRLGAFIDNADAFRELVQSVGQNLQSPKLGNVAQIFDVLDRLMQHGGGVGLMPAPQGDETWMGLARPVDLALRGQLGDTHKRMFVALQNAAAATDDGTRDRALREYKNEVVAAAEVRGEYGHIETEAQYYRANWQYRGLNCFILGFLLAAIGWLLPRSKVLWWSSFGVSSLGLMMLAYDIYLRCVITSRPPIKNLYDTFLFIAALGVLTALVVEYIMKRRIALALAPMIGALLVMLARKFEVADGKDTMDPLVAVLDSNYWLATHVTMINTGYAAGLTASALALTWIFLRVSRLAHPKDSVSKGLIRAVYGVTCFSLLFSVVGTIYGGVWANDSWGRFWGWDPKENGALMICLSQIALLHARWSGMIKDFGIVLWASATGMVVLFSWFHTNLLGVGLHNYGFSSALRDGVWISYCGHLGLMLVGAVDVLARPNPPVPVVSPPPLPATE